MNLIIILIIFIIITLILFKIFKTILKTIISLSIIIIITSIILLSLIYLDISSFKEEFTRSDNLILLKDNIPLTGIVFNQEKNTSNPLSELELSNINIKNNNYYKTIIFNLKYIEESPEETIFVTKDTILTKQQIISILKSDTPIEEFKKDTNNQQFILETEKSKFKSKIFLLMFNENMPFYTLIKEYKRGNVEIYPETITFKIIKLIPISILKNIQ